MTESTSDFNVAEYINQFPRELLESSQGRIGLCKTRPLLFALLYLSHHISFDNEPPDFSQFHLDLFEYGKTLAGLDLGNEQTRDETNLQRDAWLAPRASGKSTILFTVLPLWLAAMEHVEFIAAFSDSENQAIIHLQTFKSELDNNELLRNDFPDLCRPKKSRATNKYVSQSQIMIQQANGFIFTAKGIDSQSLGMKVGVKRPEVIICDDIESLDYSINAAKSRLNTLLHGVFALNYRAKIIIVGTCPIAGGILDNLRTVNDQLQQYESRAMSQLDNTSDSDGSIDAAQSVEGGDDSYLEHVEQSVATVSEGLITNVTDEKDFATVPEGFITNVTNGQSKRQDTTSGNTNANSQKNDVKSTSPDRGTSSTQHYMNPIYPEGFEEQLDNDLKWPVHYQIKVHHYLPIIENGGVEQSLWPSQWSLDYLKSIQHTRDFAMNYMNRPVSMDAGYWADDDIEIEQPGSFDKVLLSVDPAVSTKKTADFSAFAVVGMIDEQIYVIHTEQLRGSPDELRAVTERLIADYDVKLVLWEKNYGDTLWKAVLDGIKCKIRFIRNTEKKEARITQSLDAYKRGKVKHCKSMLSLEEQMTSYPNVRHDDLIDSVATGVNYFASHKPKAQVRQASYL